MSIIAKNNTFISYLLLLFAVFIIIFFTKGEYEKLQKNLDIKNKKQILLEEKESELLFLNKVKNTLNENASEYKKYSSGGDEASILEYIYAYIDKGNNLKNEILPKSIIFGEEKKNDFGFFEKTININVSVSNEETMMKFLDFFMDLNSKYAFFIESFSYPNNKTKGGFNVHIPIKIFYK